MSVHPSSTPQRRKGGETPPTTLRTDRREEGERGGELRRTNEWYHDAIARCHDQLSSLNGQARVLRESVNEDSLRDNLRSSLRESSVASSRSNITSVAAAARGKGAAAGGGGSNDDGNGNGRMSVSVRSGEEGRVPVQRLYPEMLSPVDTLELMENVLRRSFNRTDDRREDVLSQSTQSKDNDRLVSSIDSSSSFQTEDDDSNSFRYMTMEVPTSTRNSQTLIQSSVDFSP